MMKEPKNELKNSCIYFDLTDHERESAIRYLLGAILKCRQGGKFPSNYYTFDEDVNVYLAHLLFAVSLPEYHEMTTPYLSMDSSDILNWIRGTEDRALRYFIFKVNADYILLHSAVFEDLSAKRLQTKMFKHSSKHFRELAKLYYDQAAAYHRRIYRKQTGVGDVLEKLAHYFDAYQMLLQTVRREYFSFLTNFRNQVFSNLNHEIREYENGLQFKNRMDEFLDLYGQWLRTKDPALARQVRQLAAELKAADPNFKFDLNQRGLNEGE